MATDGKEVTRSDLLAMGWKPSDGFWALGHPVRILILNLLRDNGPVRYAEISRLIRLKGGSIAYHMRVLKPYLNKSNDGLYELNDLGKYLMQLFLATRNSMQKFEVSNLASSKAARLGKQQSDFELPH